MSETVFCEQCGASIGASASFCASCGSAQAPTVVSPDPAPPLTADRDVHDVLSESASPAASVVSPDEPLASVPPPRFTFPPRSAIESIATPHEQAPPEAADGHGPPANLGAAPPPPPSQTGISPAAPRGRLTRALEQARGQGDSQIVASFWLGWTSFGSALIGLLAKSSALYFIGIVTGIIAIVTARFARQRAQSSGDIDLVYLSRYGQITGWIVVGLFIAVLLLFAAFFGSFLGSFGN